MELPAPLAELYIAVPACTQGLLHLDQILRQRVIGQDEAVEAVVYAGVRGCSSLRDSERRIGLFVSISRTGVR